MKSFPFSPLPLPLLILASLAGNASMAGLQAGEARLESTRPNIVFILADDLGFGDVHALNPNSRIPTPHLDRLAEEGMTFTDAHTPSSVCTPTRYGVLTGRYCWRTRLKSGVLNGFSPPLLAPDRPTVASLLRQHGYHTGIVGKWHLGLDFARQSDGKAIDFSQPLADGPRDHGFDYSFILPASLDFPPYVYIENHRVTAPPVIDQEAQPFPAFLRAGPRSPDVEMASVLDDLLERAVGFVRRQADSGTPFFLYFPLTAPHKPVIPHPRFQGTSDLGTYGDFIRQVDWTVGAFLRALDDASLASNTLVIFTSDNGSYMYRQDNPARPDHVDDPQIQGYYRLNHQSNYAFRGTKADIWEGGHRVPFFVRWPGKVTPGTHCRQTVCLTDFFATCREVVDAAPRKIGGEDSVSLLPLFLAEAQSVPHPPVIHHSVNGTFAIRSGPWKLVLGNGSGGRESPRGTPFGRPYQLFHLAHDSDESHDLIDVMPEQARILESQFTALRRPEADSN